MSHVIERKRRSAGEWVQFGVGAALVAAMFYPTIWMVLSAFKSNREIFRTPFALPSVWRWENFVEAWNLGGLGQLYLNSLFVTVIAVTLCVGFATAAAFYLNFTCDLAETKMPLAEFLQIFGFLFLSCRTCDWRRTQKVARQQKPARLREA